MVYQCTMRVQTDVFLLQMTDRQNNTDRVYQAVGTVGTFVSKPMNNALLCVTVKFTYLPLAVVVISISHEYFGLNFW